MCLLVLLVLLLFVALDIFCFVVLPGIPLFSSIPFGLVGLGFLLYAIFGKTTRSTGPASQPFSMPSPLLLAVLFLLPGTLCHLLGLSLFITSWREYLADVLKRGFPPGQPFHTSFFSAGNGSGRSATHFHSAPRAGDDAIDIDVTPHDSNP